MKTAYADKYKDVRWQKMRLRVFERDNWVCVRCNKLSNMVHVHPKLYVYGRDPWDYDMSFLETLCENCHAEEHGKNTVPVEIVYESKYGHLIPPKIEGPVDIINKHISELTRSLSNEGLISELEIEIIKNIRYLQEKRKEYLNG